MSAGHISAGCAVALLLAGCANGFETQTLDLPSDKTLLTSAEIRAVHRTSVGSGSREGKVEPAYITCAEPSPDVAKAFSQSFDTGLSAAVSNPAAGVDPKLAAASPRRRLWRSSANGWRPSNYSGTGSIELARPMPTAPSLMPAMHCC